MLVLEAGKHSELALSNARNSPMCNRDGSGEMKDR